MLLRNRHQNVAQNEHFYATCCQPEVDGDVMSGWKVKTIEGFVLVNFEAASSGTLWDINKNYFVTVAAEAYIDDSINRKHFVSLKKYSTKTSIWFSTNNEYDVNWNERKKTFYFKIHQKLNDWEWIMVVRKAKRKQNIQSAICNLKWKGGKQKHFFGKVAA